MFKRLLNKEIHLSVTAACGRDTPVSRERKLEKLFLVLKTEEGREGQG